MKKHVFIILLLLLILMTGCDNSSLFEANDSLQETNNDVNDQSFQDGTVYDD